MDIKSVAVSYLQFTFHFKLLDIQSNILRPYKELSVSVLRKANNEYTFKKKIFIRHPSKITVLKTF